MRLAGHCFGQKTETGNFNRKVRIIMGFFDFMVDMGNHEERKIETYDENDLFVDTCRVSDSSKPYETAVAHPAYNNGKIVIVELYDTPEEAKQGHKQWVDKMLNSPPQQLVDVSTSASAILVRANGGLPAFEKAAD